MNYSSYQFRRDVYQTGISKCERVPCSLRLSHRARSLDNEISVNYCMTCFLSHCSLSHFNPPCEVMCKISNDLSIEIEAIVNSGYRSD